MKTRFNMYKSFIFSALMYLIYYTDTLMFVM